MSVEHLYRCDICRNVAAPAGVMRFIKIDVWTDREAAGRQPSAASSGPLDVCSESCAMRMMERLLHEINRTLAAQSLRTLDGAGGE